MSEAVQVRIFNQTYVLRSPSGAERIAQAAQFVDERMRLIAAQITTYDVSKIAVLAALNIADELQIVKERYEDQLAAFAAQERRREEEQRQEAAPEATVEQTPAPAAPRRDEPQSWFESIFDADEMSAKQSRERRLSSQVAAKLQSIRQSEQQQQVSQTAREDEEGE